MPLVIAGRRIPARADGSGADLTELPLAGGTAVLPTLSADLAARLLGADKQLLADVPFQEIVSFLDRVGRNWESPEYSRRRLYIRQAVDLLGHSEKAAEAEADWISVLLTSHSRMYDMLDCELGSRYLLDRWMPREECEVRAFPLGRVVHILPGNVALSGVSSIIRALLTKNISIVKASSSDPVTPVSLALSFLDVDPDHPVARALNVVHWRAGDSVPGEALVAAADGVIAWGGGDAVSWAHRHMSPEASFLCFGPKRSMSLVGRSADPGGCAERIAHDIANYDQQACFSTQQIFVAQPVEPFVRALTRSLEEYATLLPPPRRSVDDLAAVNLTRLTEDFGGARVHAPADPGWTVIVTPPRRIAEHPLSRTAFVHPVERIEDCYPYVDDGVQTVAVTPWEMALEHRDALARRGIARLTEAGMTNVFRPGGPHDGVYPLQRLVRLVATESPSRVYGKGMVVRMDQTEALRRGRITDLML